MKRNIVTKIVLLAALSVVGVAQEPVKKTPGLPAKTIDEMKQLRDAALRSDYAYRQLAHLTDNIGPRLSGSAGAEAAVQYVAAEMRKLGLEVKLEKVMVPHWVRGVETAELVDFAQHTPGLSQKIVVTALGDSGATPPQGITAEVVVVHNFDELAALGHDRVAGKIVLYADKYDRRKAQMGASFPAYGEAVLYRNRGAQAAANLGAVASLVRTVGSADFRLPHTGATLWSSTTGMTIPAGAVAAEDADLIGRLAAQGPVKMHLTMTPQKLPDVESYNVIADLKGKENPEEVVIVSGHLDCWDLGNGAIDDGAGVVVAMATVNLMKELKLQPRRTVRFVAWMNEENGLRGGATYAADHKGDIQNHFAAIETDTGAGHPIGIGFNGTTKAGSSLADLSKVLYDAGSGLLEPLEDTGSDLLGIGALGVPTFAPIQDSRTYFDYHHSAADTLDKVSPQDLRENVATVGVLAFTLANLPASLRGN